jgi:hypothetical protein
VIRTEPSGACSLELHDRLPSESVPPKVRLFSPVAGLTSVRWNLDEQSGCLTLSML